MKPFMISECEQEIVRLKTRLEAVIPYLQGELPSFEADDLAEMESLALQTRELAEDLYRMVRSYHMKGPA